MMDFSIEATRPKQAEIEALRGILRPGTLVYLSSVSTQGNDAQIEAARWVRAAGLEPVPHLAARRFANAATLKDYLTRMRAEADVRGVLLVGGDKEQPDGPFASALDVIESGLLESAGIEEVGLAGYPEGHPKISSAELERSLALKLAAARKAGLRTGIVSQFCFDPGRVVGWLYGLRSRGIDVPVRVGMVGPTKFRTMLRYARRCGVGATVRGLWNSGAFWALLGKPHPGRMIRALSRHHGLDKVTPHLFSFGGIAETARYLRAAEDKSAGYDRKRANAGAPVPQP
ncbi:MAG: methylenetetrahydrofolate reductase [Pseudolabrys sp.]